MQDKKTPLRYCGTAAIAAVLGLLSTLAQAHPGHPDHEAWGIAAGFAHPFLGLDHLLAMAAVGVWSAAVLPAGRRVMGPAVFLAMLLLGALLPSAGLVFPGLEAGVALSLVAFGALLLAARGPMTARPARLPVPAGLALVGMAALLHGMAHGAELPPSQSFAGYAVGFMAASALLHGAGLVAGGWLCASRHWVWRGVAALVGASGLVMLAGRL